MNSPKATPEVGEDGLELASGPGLSFGGIVDDLVQDTEIEDDDEAEEPTEPVAEPSTPPTSRRSKAGAERKPAVNLDDLPEFRNWKSKTDQQLQAERNRAAELERQLQARQQAEYMAALEAQLGTAYDANEQRRIIDQIASVKAQSEMNAWQAWEQYVADRAKAEGVDPGEFKPRSYQGEAGAAQFEADLHAKARAKLAAENSELRKKAESIDVEVKRQVAEALARQGFDTVDTGTPSAPSGGSDDEWKRDMRLFNSGKMSREQFRKRWGGR